MVVDDWWSVNLILNVGGEEIDDLPSKVKQLRLLDQLLNCFWYIYGLLY